MKTLAIATVLLAVVAVPPCLDESSAAQGLRGPALVPLEYRALFRHLDAQLAAFEKQLDSSWDGSPYPVACSAELLAANSHRGTALLDPTSRDAVLLNLDRLQSLGVEAITISVGFPLLYRPFHRSRAEYLQYLDFYRWVAEEVHGRGLDLIVTSQAIFSDPSYTDLEVADFYRTLSFAQYVDGRRQVLITLARHLMPDYLTVMEEPDTEALQTGQPVNNVIVATEMVSYFLGGLEAARHDNLEVGAGVGTWHPHYRDFVTSFASKTELDFVDMHIYPVNFDFLNRSLVVADIAKAHGKKVTMSEAWLYKAKKSELGSVTYTSVFARDVYSFWAPLDARFLSVLVKLAQSRQLEFISPFWIQYFFAYLDYREVHRLSPEERLALATQAAAINMILDRHSPTGEAYRRLIEGPGPE